jgi:hypothetical protein
MDNIVVYRSESERAIDQVLWNGGYLYITIAVVIALGGMWAYQAFREWDRVRQVKKSLRDDDYP